MLKLSTRRGHIMVLRDPEKILLSTLKGRISKVFNVSSKLTPSEKQGLSNVLEAIDSFLTGGHRFEHKENFKKYLSECLHLFIEDTKKGYIKKYILPIITKVSEKDKN